MTNMNTTTQCATWRVIDTKTAWDSIGHDGPVRIKGGRAIYDAVIKNMARSRSNAVLLARLGNYSGGDAFGLEQHNRWVGPDVPLEYLEWVD